MTKSTQNRFVRTACNLLKICMVLGLIGASPAWAFELPDRPGHVTRIEHDRPEGEAQAQGESGADVSEPPAPQGEAGVQSEAEPAPNQAGQAGVQSQEAQGQSDQGGQSAGEPSQNADAQNAPPPRRESAQDSEGVDSFAPDLADNEPLNLHGSQEGSTAFNEYANQGVPEGQQQTYGTFDTSQSNTPMRPPAESQPQLPGGGDSPITPDHQTSVGLPSGETTSGQSLPGGDAGIGLGGDSLGQTPGNSQMANNQTGYGQNDGTSSAEPNSNLTGDSSGQLGGNPQDGANEAIATASPPPHTSKPPAEPAENPFQHQNTPQPSSTEQWTPLAPQLVENTQQVLQQQGAQLQENIQQAQEGVQTMQEGVQNLSQGNYMEGFQQAINGAQETFYGYVEGMNTIATTPGAVAVEVGQTVVEHTVSTYQVVQQQAQTYWNQALDYVTGNSNSGFGAGGGGHTGGR